MITQLSDPDQEVEMEVVIDNLPSAITEIHR